MIRSLSGWRPRLDKLKAASLNKKLNELQNRVFEMMERAHDQLELLEVFSKHVTCLLEEVSNEKNSREG